MLRLTASEVLIKASVNWHSSDMALSGHIIGRPTTVIGAGTGMLGWLVVADDVDRLRYTDILAPESRMRSWPRGLISYSSGD